MHAAHLIPRPREVRLIGVVQPGPFRSAYATPGIRGSGQIEFVWRQSSVEATDETFDLLMVSATGVSVAATTRALARVRAGGWQKGLVVLMDRSQLSAAPRFVAAGATDFILTDTEAEEAECRLLGAMLRPTAQQETPPIPAVTLDWKHRAVLLGDTRVRLTMREMQLLDVMLQTTEPIASAALAEKAWGHVPSESSNLVSVCVCNIRRKLARFGSSFGIRTHRGAGYSAEVRRD